MQTEVSLLYSLLFVIVLLAGGQDNAAAPERVELMRVVATRFETAQFETAHLEPRRVALTRFEFTEIHMAMPVRIVMFAPDSSRARTAAMSAFRRIATLEATMSDYRAQSELRRVQTHAGVRIRVSKDLFDVLAQSVRMAGLTNGAFDPTVGSLVSLWRDARRTGILPSSMAIDSARAHTGWRRISLDRATRTVLLNGPAKLDLGAIAKGFILQEAMVVLQEAGISRLMIEAGGDIVVGKSGWRVEVPGASDAFALQAQSLVNVALATSGPAMQHADIGGVRYSHVVDPRSGMAVTRSTTAWVIASDAAVADALATAITVMDDSEIGAVRARFPNAMLEVRF